jgi:hypothetical protein
MLKIFTRLDNEGQDSFSRRREPSSSDSFIGLIYKKLKTYIQFYTKKTNVKEINDATSNICKEINNNSKVFDNNNSYTINTNKYDKGSNNSIIYSPDNNINSDNNNNNYNCNNNNHIDHNNHNNLCSYRCVHCATPSPNLYRVYGSTHIRLTYCVNFYFSNFILFF